MTEMGSPKAKSLFSSYFPLSSQLGFIFLFASSIFCTLVVRKGGPVSGEVEVTRWMSENSPAFIELFHDVSDPLLTDIAAPIVFAVLVLVVWIFWGRFPAIILGFAGACTALTRIGDLVNRPRPTSDGQWMAYSFGNGGYPSGHVIFTVLVFGTIWTLSTSNVSSRVSKWIARSVLLLIILTCWSRISELEHWPLDVVGGLCMSAAALIVIVSVNKNLPELFKGDSSLGRLLGLTELSSREQSA